MTSTDDARAAAQRLVLLSALVDLAKEELAVQRVTAADAMEPGEAHAVRTPDGQHLARVRMTNPKPTTSARVTDHVALVEWIGREHPERITVTPSVSTDTESVLAVLAEHAPHLVALPTSVPAWVTEEILTLSRKAGRPVGPGGEVDVPGVTVDTTAGTPSVQVAEKAPDFLVQVAQLATSGRLALDGTLRELPAAAGPVVVDAEPGPGVTRDFTVAELEELDVTGGGAAVLLDEEHDVRRWYTFRRVVFRADGQLWQTLYREPATEMQEVEAFESDPVACTLVQPYEVPVTKYRPASGPVVVDAEGEAA